MFGRSICQQTHGNPTIPIFLIFRYKFSKNNLKMFDVAIPFSRQIADEEQKLWFSLSQVRMTIHEKLVIRNFSLSLRVNLQRNSMSRHYLIKKSKVSATVLALIFFNGKASTHLVKQSTTTNKYLFPETVNGSDPRTSIWTLSNGAPTL